MSEHSWRQVDADDNEIVYDSMKMKTESLIKSLQLKSKPYTLVTSGFK